VYSFFSHNPKMQMEFLKLANLMKAKGSKILCNVKTCWINMLQLTKRAMAMYMPLVAKMVEDNPSIMSTKVNFKLLCHKNLLSFFLVFPMFKFVHALIKFAHKRVVFVYNYVTAIKIYQG